MGLERSDSGDSVERPKSPERVSLEFDEALAAADRAKPWEQVDPGRLDARAGKRGELPPTPEELAALRAMEAEEGQQAAGAARQPGLGEVGEVGEPAGGADRGSAGVQVGETGQPAPEGAVAEQSHPSVEAIAEPVAVEAGDADDAGRRERWPEPGTGPVDLPPPGDDPGESAETGETAGESTDRAQPGESTASHVSGQAGDLVEHHLTAPPDTDDGYDTDDQNHSEPNELDPNTDNTDNGDSGDGGSSGTDTESGSADDEQWPTQPQTELEPGTVVLTRDDPDTRYSVHGPVDPEPGEPYYAVVEEGGRHRRLEGPIRPEHTELPTGLELTDLPDDASTTRRLTRVGVEGGDDLADTWDHQIEPHIDLHQTDTQKHAEGTDVTDGSDHRSDRFEVDEAVIDAGEIAQADDGQVVVGAKHDGDDTLADVHDTGTLQPREPTPEVQQADVGLVDYAALLAGTLAAAAFTAGRGAASYVQRRLGRGT